MAARRRRLLAAQRPAWNRIFRLGVLGFGKIVRDDAAGLDSVEPSRPTGDRISAADAKCSSSANPAAPYVPQVGPTDRNAGWAGQGPGLASSRSKAVNDTSGSRDRHGVGHGRVLGWPSAIRRRQSAGKLRGHDSPANIPATGGSGSANRANKATRCCAFSGVKQRCT